MEASLCIYIEDDIKKNSVIEVICLMFLGLNAVFDKMKGSWLLLSIRLYYGLNIEIKIEMIYNQIDLN